MNPSKVSVIIALYNTQQYVRETIQSVLNQSYENFELIIIDDGSTDKSAEIVKSINDKRIRYLFQVNQGRSRARNAGIEIALGEYIAFLDSDDIWPVHHLEKSIQTLEKHPEIHLTFSEIELIDEKSNLLSMNKRWNAKQYSGCRLSELFNENFIPFSTAVIKKKCLEGIELFDPLMEPAEDWDLWLRLAKAGCNVQFIPESIVQYRWKRTNFLRTYQKSMSEGSIRVLMKIYKSGPLNDAALSAMKRSFLVHINNLVSTVYPQFLSPDILSHLKEIPFPLPELMKELLFWKIIAKWITGNKISFFKHIFKH